MTEASKGVRATEAGVMGPFDGGEEEDALTA
jgi:hypothetical protein